MSRTTAKVMVGRYEESAAKARLVGERYPEAWVDESLGGMYVSENANPNCVFAVTVDGEERLVPTEKVERDGVVADVAKRMYFYTRTHTALEFLREKHPKAYGDLVKWVSE
jgi:hypothetical protein